MTMLELQIRAETAVTDLVERSRDEEGQTSIEYLGIVVVVGIILAAILAAAPGFASSITSEISEQIKNITGAG